MMNSTLPPYGSENDDSLTSYAKTGATYAGMIVASGVGLQLSALLLACGFKAASVASEQAQRVVKLVNKNYLKSVGLPSFTIDFGAEIKAKRNNGDHVQRAYNRDALIRRIEGTLGSSNCSAVILHGPAGVGKTSIVEQLIYRHISGESTIFAGYKILKLQQDQLFDEEKGIYQKLVEFAMTNGTHAAMSRLIEELGQEKYILFVDEAHSILGSAIFQKRLEELGRGKVKIIFATTTKEMESCTRNWSDAMNRRFPKIEIPEFSIDEMIAALVEGKSDYEKTLQVTLTNDALQAIVALSSQIREQKFPHKAIELLHQVCLASKSTAQPHPNIDEKVVFEHYAQHDQGCGSSQYHEEFVRKTLGQLDQSTLVTHFTAMSAPSTSSASTEPFFSLSVSLKDEFNKLRSYITGVKCTFLIEPSRMVLKSILEYFATERQIIAINLRNLADLYDPLGHRAKQALIEHYNQTKEQQKNGKKPLFYVEDGENLLALIARGKHSKLSSHNSFVPHNLDVAAERMLMDGFSFLRDAIPAIDIPLPNNRHSSAEPKPSQISSKVDTYGLPSCALVQQILKDIQDGTITVIAAPSNSDNCNLDPRYANKFQNYHMPSLRFSYMIEILRVAYQGIDPNIISQTLFTAMYLFPQTFAMDAASAVLDNVREHENANPLDIVKQSFVDLMKSSKEPVEAKLQLIESIASQHTVTTQKFYSQTISTKSESTNASPEVRKAVLGLFNKEKMTFLIIQESDRTEFFTQMQSELTPNTTVYKFSAQSLLTTNLRHEFKIKILFDQLIELKEIMAKQTEQCVFVIDIPTTLQSPEIARLLETMVTPEGVRGIYYCSPEEAVEKPMTAAIPTTSSPIFDVVVSFAVNHFTKQSAPANEGPTYKLPQVFANSKRVVQIDLKEEMRKSQESTTSKIATLASNWLATSINTAIEYGTYLATWIYGPTSFLTLASGAFWATYSNIKRK